MKLTCVIPGVPVPQGSIRSLGAGRPSVHSNAAILKPWRATVIAALREAMGDTSAYPMEGPVRVTAVFFMPRPKSAPKSRFRPDRKPDLDKLCRAVHDALTQAGVVRDDSQIVTLIAEKYYTNVPQAELTIETLSPPPDLKVVK